ncbi:hypothetical protein [Mycoplasma sp. P36-A1]|uniref:hypothetical protein n=1 Tax=Mycoplasma sp. P36-A1 TaxID=3252900 RepID=UPI003C2D2A13
MELIASQAIVAIIIILLFAITLKYDKNKITSKEMTMVAILCVLTAILSKTLSIKLPPGQPLFVISLAMCVTTTIGLLVSPKLALIAGFIIDLIGIALAPLSGDMSMPFLGFTLSAMLGVYIPSVMIRKTKYTSQKTLNMIIYIFLAIMLLLGYLYINNTTSLSIDGVKNELTSSIKNLVYILLVVMSVVVIIVNSYFAKKYNNKNNKLYVTTSHITLIVLVSDVVTSIIGTSLWINIMYGVQFDIAASTRIVKTILQLPINVVLIFLILKYMPMQYKKHLLKDSKQK